MSKCPALEMASIFQTMVQVESRIPEKALKTKLQEQMSAFWPLLTSVVKGAGGKKKKKGAGGS